MKQIALPSEAREIDKKMMLDKKIPGLLLMEQAAVAIFRTVERLDLSSRRVLVVAGGGNNGGDAFAAARILLINGYDVQVGYVPAKELPGDAATNYAFLSTLGG